MMIRGTFLLIAFVALGLAAADTFAPSRAVTPSQLETLGKFASQKSDGSFGSISETHYAVGLLKILGQNVPNSDKVCAFASKHLTPQDLKSSYHAAAIYQQLSCSGEVASALKTKLATVIDNSDNAEDLFHAVSSVVGLTNAKALKFDFSDLQPVIGRLTDLMMDDGTFRPSDDAEHGSVTAAGYAYHALAAAYKKVATDLDDDELEQLLSVSETAGNLFLFAFGENSIQFLDESSTGSNLQLTTTVLTGVNALAGALQQPMDISGDQIGKIAEGYIRSWNVDNVVDAYFLARGLKACAKNNIHIPMVVEVTSTKPFTVSVTNVLGKKATDVSAAIRVYDAASEEDELEADLQGKDTTFTGDVSALSAGSYVIEVTVSPLDEDNDLFEETVKEISHNVKAALSLANVKVQLADIDVHAGSSKTVKTLTANYPSSLSEGITLSHNQRLTVSFTVKAGSKAVQTHQTFVKFTHESGATFYQVAVFDGESFESELETTASGSALIDSKSGKFTVELLVGDHFAEKPITFKLGNANINALGEPAAEVAAKSGPLPEIEHLFREPEPRPPRFVSDVFTLIILSPFAILLLLLLKNGANISAFPTSGTHFLFAVLYQGCLGAILFLLFNFWVHLTIFTTVKLLVALGGITFLVGHQHLRFHRAEESTRE